MLRSNSKNKENLNSKERRTSSLQRRRSVLSILSSSSSIQKPERGRSQNRIITNNYIDINKVITTCRNDNGTINVDIQQNNLSSEQPQSSISPDHLSHQNDIEDGIERSDNESSGGNRSWSTTSRDNV
ncbi:unnamed protein product [Rotaria sp. Silwood1]|nr:unnamed protein product [Rotaria sp. Silwood1]CAF1690801.1 unnamed protein product [Rotaria sp. Silwood1]CAF3665993.1 unnamed protein product [Rotaria sp. Silwood1]CAF3720574.1 unnamed protein product [Rotaria sp. Silwood1]